VPAVKLPSVVGVENIVAIALLPGFRPFSARTKMEPAVTRAGTSTVAVAPENFIERSTLPMLPEIDDEPDHVNEPFTFDRPLRMVIPPVEIFGFGVVVEVVVLDVSVVGAAVVDVVVVDADDFSVADAGGAVVDVVESLGVVVSGALEGGVVSFDGGVGFDGGAHGDEACCHKRNGRVWDSQIPQVLGLVDGLDQPDSIDQPAVSKTEWVFIVAGVASASDGCVPPWSLKSPIGFNPVTPVRPASQCDDSSAVECASPTSAPTFVTP
jgi:hypothetical protein